MSTSICPRAEQLEAWRAGTLAQQEAAEVAEHVGNCSLCQRSMKALTQPAHDSGDDLSFLKAPETPDELGRIGFFRVLRLVGAGGMGMVFEAEDLRLQRKVALKVMKPELAEDALARTRFLREARAVAAVNSDHIVTIHHVGMEGQLPMLAMELLAGQTLRERLTAGRELSIAEILRITREIVLGLKAAHDCGLVHRDIKPENIWLKPSGQVKILDFGLARFDEPLDSLTREGRAVGTPGYISPEQARGQWVDQRSDLFSLGCVLYELLTGKSPFQRETMMACLTALAIEEPEPIRTQRAAVPASLERLVLQLLAKIPEERPASASVVLQHLDLIQRRLSEHDRGVSSQDLPADAAPEPVNLVQGDVVDYRSASRELLRHRLRAMAIIMMIGFVWSLLNDQYWGNFELIGFRLLLIALLLGIFGVLVSKWPLSTAKLRLLDMLLVASICALALSLPTRNMLDAAAAGQFSMAVAERASTTTVWCLLIVCHALFVPSPWKREALILFAIALLADLQIVLLERWSPALRQAWDIPFFRMPIRLPMVAALIGTYSAYLIDRLRYQAFQGQLLGQYMLKDQIGTGPLGDVFRGEHFQLKRPCAVKLIRPAAVDNEAMQRFEKALQVAATLNHPGIVAIYDYGRSRDGVLYCVMELLPGLTVAEVVEEYGPLPPGRVVHLIGQAAQALAEAHSFGFFHANLKPSNLMITRRGQTCDHVKLLDFGLSLVAGDKQVAPEAALYTSPEQLTGVRLDARSDIYALGAVAYYLLTGQPVFPATSLMRLVVAHSRDPAPPPGQINPDVPEDLQKIILRCLEKEPDARYASAQDLKDALAGCSCADDWTEELGAHWWRHERA